jgi:hypothetical protein
MEDDMTKQQERRYSEPELLKDILERVLKGLKFRLECGHYAESIVMRTEVSQV